MPDRLRKHLQIRQHPGILAIRVRTPRTQCAHKSRLHSLQEQENTTSGAKRTQLMGESVTLIRKILASISAEFRSGKYGCQFPRGWYGNASCGGVAFSRVQNRYNLSVPNVLFNDLQLPTVPLSYCNGMVDLAPEASALPGCATPRKDSRNHSAKLHELCPAEVEFHFAQHRGPRVVGVLALMLGDLAFRNLSFHGGP